VWLIDGDRQGTAAAIAARAEAGRQLGIACAQYADGPALRGQVQQQRDKWQDIIIDVWALDDMAALVDETRSVRDGLRCYPVMNQADPGEHSADNADAAAAVAEVPQFEYLPTPSAAAKRSATPAARAWPCPSWPHATRKRQPRLIVSFHRFLISKKSRNRSF
jgi:hypothetical protein